MRRLPLVRLRLLLLLVRFLLVRRVYFDHFCDHLGALGGALEDLLAPFWGPLEAYLDPKALVY